MIIEVEVEVEVIRIIEDTTLRPDRLFILPTGWQESITKTHM